MAISTTDAQKLYLAYFGRPADPTGLNYYTTVPNVTLAAVQSEFAASKEYAAMYSGNNTALVNQMYNNILGRDGDAEGLIYWSVELYKGAETVASLANALMNSAKGDDLTTINNRIAYASAFTAALDTSAELVAYAGSAAASLARDLLKSITTDASLEAALTTLDAAVAKVTATTAAVAEPDPGDNGGGASSTIQIGADGVGINTVSESELAGETNIALVDLRGEINNLTLPAQFVAAAATANAITVTTAEAGAASTNTVRLTALDGEQSVTFVGGPGSDRLILNDRNFNTLQILDGGTTDDAGIATGEDRYDTITVTSNGGNVVIDRNDLAHVSNFEGLILTKNAAAVTYNIELTQAFLGANTLDSDIFTGIQETAINDVVFQIGTYAAANNLALTAADTVIIDLRDLLNASDTGLSGDFPYRLDVGTLLASGASVRFIGNTSGGAPLLTATNPGVAALLLNDGVGENDVVALSAAYPIVDVNTLTFTGTSGNTTTGFEIADGKTASASVDTINIGSLVLASGAVLNGGGGSDTLLATNGANISALSTPVSSIENLNFTGTFTLTKVEYQAFSSVTGDTVLFSDNASGVTTHSGVATYDFSAGYTLATTGSSGGSGGQTFKILGNAAFTVSDTLTGGAGSADVVVLDDYTGLDDFDFLTGVETIKLLPGHTVGVAPTAAMPMATDTTQVTIDATSLTVGETYNLAAVTNRGFTIKLNLANAVGDTITGFSTVMNVANAHAVSGLGAGDKLDFAVDATQAYSVTIANFDNLTFVADVNAAVASLGAAYTPSATGALLVNIAGTTDSYLVVGNLTVAGGLVSGADEVVKLIGANTLTIDGTALI